MREYGGNIHFIRLEAQTLTFETRLPLGQEAIQFQKSFSLRQRRYLATIAFILDIYLQ